MRRTVYYCDRCGKSLDIIEPWMAVDYEETRMDFCETCAGAALGLLLEFTKGKPEEKPEEPKKVIPKAPHGGDRRSLKLDLGKVGALHAAGWSNAKIAQEMGCSPQTIGNHLDKAISVYAERQEMLAHAEPDSEL